MTKIGFKFWSGNLVFDYIGVFQAKFFTVLAQIASAPSLIKSMILYEIIFKTTWGLKGWHFERRFTDLHLPSPVTCHVSHVTFQVSNVTFKCIYIYSLLIHLFLDQVVKLIGGGSFINGASQPSYNKQCIARLTIHKRLRLRSLETGALAQAHYTIGTASKPSYQARESSLSSYSSLSAQKSRFKKPLLLSRV